MTKQAFLELYDKVDADFQMPEKKLMSDEQFIHPYGPLVYKTKIEFTLSEALLETLTSPQRIL